MGVTRLFEVNGGWHAGGRGDESVDPARPVPARLAARARTAQPGQAAARLVQATSSTPPALSAGLIRPRAEASAMSEAAGSRRSWHPRTSGARSNCSRKVIGSASVTDAEFVAPGTPSAPDAAPARGVGAARTGALDAADRARASSEPRDRPQPRPTRPSGPRRSLEARSGDLGPPAAALRELTPWTTLVSARRSAFSVR